MSELPGGLVGHIVPERVVVISDSSWALGGAEIMALLSAEVMAEVGLPVTFIAGDDAAKCPLDRSLIEVIALGGASLLERNPLDAAFDGLYSQKTLERISRFIAERDTPATIYHLHNWSHILSPSIFKALKPVESRLFISAHDFAIACPNLSYSNYQKAGQSCPLKPLSLECITTHCDRRSYAHKLWRVLRSMKLHKIMDFASTPALVGMIHPFMSEWYERGGIPQSRLRVVRNPVNPFSKTRIAAEDNSDVFFIGRLVAEKGPDLACEAARLCGRRIRVIGDGDMRETLTKRYPNAVFEGWRNHAQIGELLKQARCVIVPSRLPETFTLVAHEALRSGVPVIAFDDVDGVEMAELGGALVVPPREASSLAGALSKLDDDAVVARMSQIAFDEGGRFSNTRESWRDALLALYGELLQRSLDGEGASPPKPTGGASSRAAPAIEALATLTGGNGRSLN